MEFNVFWDFVYGIPPEIKCISKENTFIYFYLLRRVCMCAPQIIRLFVCLEYLIAASDCPPIFIYYLP